MALRPRAEAKTELLLAALTLRELVQDRGHTQVQLAAELDRAQGNVSRMVRRADMHMTTFKQLVEALGAELEITARFPDQAYRIEQFATAEP